MGPHTLILPVLLGVRVLSHKRNWLEGVLQRNGPLCLLYSYTTRINDGLQLLYTD